MKSLIAIMGPKHSGKSELAKQLTRYNYARTFFADPLKQMLTTLLRFQGASDREIAGMLYGDLKEIPTEYLEGKSPRWAMQTLGTEWRDMISPDLYVNVWKRSLVKYNRNSNVVVDDLRFSHEEKVIRELNGIIVLINREGCNPGDHPSEKEYLKILPDLVINNNETPKKMLLTVFDYLDKD